LWCLTHVLLYQVACGLLLLLLALRDLNLLLLLLLLAHLLLLLIDDLGWKVCKQVLQVMMRLDLAIGKQVLQMRWGQSPTPPHG
jgi:hypothetical protein